MKWFFVSYLALAVAFAAQAQSLDDQYVQIFNLIQEADTLSTTAPSQALSKYLEAQTALQRFQKGNPDWNAKIVSFRQMYVASKIATISAKAPPAAPAEAVPNVSTPASPETAQPSTTVDWQTRVNRLNGELTMLREQARQLQAEKVLLQSKLKEALAMQPAESDPRELARVEEKLKSLQKENELLKVALEQEKSKPNSMTDSKTLEQTRQQLAQQKELVSKLALEKEALQTRQISSASDNERMTALQAENQSLKKQLQPPVSGQKLDSANTQPASDKTKSAVPGLSSLEEQLLIAHARLQAIEARAVPYSAEELALLKRPETKLATAEPRPGRKSVKELPPGSAKLVAEAQAYFSAKKYEQAEAAYLQVLQQDPKNVPTLANLAAIQVEAKHFEAAEKNIQQALALEPNDTYSLYVLGLLKFRQAKYDAALDVLGRCAQLDPQNAEVQNYLGLALSEKGMRAPAEAALRKAIQLQPGYGGAHYNLAIIYLNQQPPSLELARWHYQKAIAAGQPHNEALEKKFASNQ